MIPLLQEPRFRFVSDTDKAFIEAFDMEMVRLGYNFGGQIGDGFCWGKYMLIYRKAGVKSQKVYARIYLREEDIVLRLFLSGIDKHRQYIEQASAHIQDVFTHEFSNCHHCHNQKEDGSCKFRKSYTLDGVFYEKCNGNTFWFFQPQIEKIPEYISLFTEFYPAGKQKKAA